jgi:hypothetical protein
MATSTRFRLARTVSLLLLVTALSCVRAPTDSASSTLSVPVSSAATPAVTYGALQWRAASPMTSPRSHLNVVVVDGSVIAIGGLLRGGATSQAFERYDPDADHWSTLPALPVGTDHAMAAAIASSIFVFGGTFAQPSSRAFRFDIGANQWSTVAPLPEPRAAGGAAAVGSRVYVFGGFDATRRLLTTAYAYDTASDRWTSIADLPSPREHLAVVAFRGAVCGLGGHLGDGKALTVMECYDPATDRWTPQPPLLRAASDFDAAVALDAIWTVGDEVQVFDGSRWWIGPPLKTPRFGVSAASTATSLFAVGGTARTAASDGLVERLEVRSR